MDRSCSVFIQDVWRKCHDCLVAETKAHGLTGWLGEVMLAGQGTSALANNLGEGMLL